MALYSMRCGGCGFEEDVYRSILEGPPERCPECGAAEADGYTQKWGELNAGGWVYGEDRITELGQQAERNEKKLGKELTQKAFESMKTQKEEANPFAGLPGVKAGKPEGKTPWWRDGSVEGLPKKDRPVDAKKLDTPEKKERYIREGKA